MFRSKANKEPERFYLLPGMGGRAFRRKQVTFWKWSVVAGLVVAAMVAAVIYLLNRLGP